LIGSCSGYFYAIDKDTGQLRWKYTIEQDGDQTSFRDDPLVAGDLIIIGTDAGRQGHIYAFDRSTGKVRWKYLVHTGTLQDFGVRSDMVRKGDAIYAVATGDDLLCLDLAAGEVRWHFASGFDRQRTDWENSPAVDGDKILFAAMPSIRIPAGRFGKRSFALRLLRVLPWWEAASTLALPTASITCGRATGRSWAQFPFRRAVAKRHAVRKSPSRYFKRFLLPARTQRDSVSRPRIARCPGACLAAWQERRLENGLALRLAWQRPRQRQGAPVCLLRN
jgi:PQQ-like domain